MLDLILDETHWRSDFADPTCVKRYARSRADRVMRNL